MSKLTVRERILFASVMPGRVSHGTMCNEDLIPVFISALDDIREEIIGPGSTTQSTKETMARAHMAGAIDYVVGPIEARMAKAEEDDVDYWTTEAPYWDVEELTTLLGDLAPPGHYFGLHPGYGGVYGYWACEEDETDECDSDE